MVNIVKINDSTLTVQEDGVANGVPIPYLAAFDVKGSGKGYVSMKGNTNGIVREIDVHFSDLRITDAGNSLNNYTPVSEIDAFSKLAAFVANFSNGGGATPTPTPEAEETAVLTVLNGTYGSVDGNGTGVIGIDNIYADNHFELLLVKKGNVVTYSILNRNNMGAPRISKRNTNPNRPDKCYTDFPINLNDSEQLKKFLPKSDVIIPLLLPDYSTLPNANVYGFLTIFANGRYSATIYNVLSVNSAYYNMQLAAGSYVTNKIAEPELSILYLENSEPEVPIEYDPETDMYIARAELRTQDAVNVASDLEVNVSWDVGYDDGTNFNHDTLHTIHVGSNMAEIELQVSPHEHPEGIIPIRCVWNVNSITPTYDKTYFYAAKVFN